LAALRRLNQSLGATGMRSRKSKIPTSTLLIAILSVAIIAGCAHRLGPGLESTRVVRELGLVNCTATEPLRRYEALDYADLIGNPNLADSPEWAKAISMMQAGDDLRFVNCKSGNNYFGLFRGKSMLLKFGGMLSD
jgi:hypothetical protein